MKKHNFFATPIWHENILNEKYNNTLKNFILNLSKKENSVFKTNYGGWQSQNNLQKLEIFNELFNIIEKQFKNSEPNIKKINIRQAWANINYKNNFNIIHNHGESNFAMIYYVDVPKDSGLLTIRDPRPGAIAFPGNGAKAMIDLNPMAGDLLIFPGFLDHFVKPSNSKIARISVAADYDAVYF
jgi:uncharacterized protein (TIGR02466 family)